LKNTVSSCFLLLGYFVSLIFAYPTTTTLSNNYQYDMIFPPTQSRGVALSADGTRWTNGIVPYVMSNQFTTEQIALITGAMRRIEQATAINNRQCVRFRPKISTDEYSILVKTGVGCSSHVGQITGWKGQRELTLQVPNSPYDSHCMNEGIIIHELLHTLGFKHEHQRPDRDLHVTIDYANVEDEYAFAFDKQPSAAVDTQGTPYDYNSIMHYGETYFSSNGKRTIIPKISTATIGQRKNLSPIDIKEIQLFYKCQ
jgi:hypothetical protein